MQRAIWKGAISFGLVHVPVALYPASQEIGIDFDWLDKRSMDPVGYKRVNKRTGEEMQADDVVKGIKQDDGAYVVLTDEQIKAAYPRATQTIEIESFAKATEIPFFFLERPYYLEPIGKGEKVYALLREAMAEAGVIGIARVVMHTKEHLAALIPFGAALILNTIRWASEIRPMDELKLPAKGAAAVKLKSGEIKMATQLINEMTAKWNAEDYTDTFSDAVHKLVNRKVKSGDTERVTPIEDMPAGSGSSNVIDLTALLAKSLGKRKQATGAKPSQPGAMTKRRTAASTNKAIPKAIARKRA
jgi:DNA end-binding protein Ku